jgi:antitoxin (DNA-binding transcriptional repressor) of toxin-antitoxin stability system
LLGDLSATMRNMRKTSVRELHINTSALVREAAEGSVIVIERRGEPVAELRPISSPSGMSRAAKELIFVSMKDVWDRMPLTNDSTKTIAEDRDR